MTEKATMFTGIVGAVGALRAARDLGTGADSGKVLEIDVEPGFLDDVRVGDSIALNGACMTATTVDAGAGRFTVDISAESLARTTGLDRPGAVNLEKALRMGDRLGGHMVSGHVDGVGTVHRFEPVGESWALEVLVPRALARYMARKGSVALNGVSLTINQVVDVPDGCRIAINLIPHTLQNTVFRTARVGDRVNVEVDLLVRHIDRLLAAAAAGQGD